MATLKGVQRAKRGPSYSGKFMIDTVRGVLRVRKWPRKRGTPKSALQRWWIDWFRQANLLAKYVDAASARRAIEITANSGMYPRDVLLAAMRGRLYTWQDQNGKVWHPMAAVQDISESLDVLAQNVSNVLVRAVDRWRAAGPPSPTVGHVLTFKGAALPPEWDAAGSDVTQQVVPGTPITPDNTKALYDVDVSNYANVEIILDGIGFAAVDRATFRFSTDGGTTFRSGGSDYSQIYVSSVQDGTGDVSQAYTSPTTATANHNVRVTLASLRAGRATYNLVAGIAGVGAMVRQGFANFDGPVTHIRVLSQNANNFNAGVIRMTGIRAA